MKRLLLLLLLTGSGLMAAAQYYPVKFGLKAGATYATFSAYSIEGGEAQLDYRTSFYGGATVELQLSETFSLQSGLSYVGKGAKGNFEEVVFESDIPGLDLSLSGAANIKLNYLELPLNALVSLPSGDGNFFFGGGPYYAYGMNAGSTLSFKINGEEVDPSEYEEEPIRFGEGGLTRTDYGVNLVLGYQLYSGLRIEAGYGLGLKTILQDPDNPDIKVKNRHFSLGLGFSF